MNLNIIHLPKRIDRWQLLQRQIREQNIKDYRLWEGITDNKMPFRGISRAHKQIIEFAKNENHAEILIAEDDICFTDVGAFDFFLKNKPPDYDIYLGGIYSGFIEDDNSVDDFSGLTLYIVKQKFYDTFLSVSDEKNIDRALKGLGKFIVCNPLVVMQHNGFSDNKKIYCNYFTLIKNRSFFARKL